MASAYAELKYGAKGNDVSALQTALAKQGLSVQATGEFDDATQAALKSYQQQAGLTADGIAGNATLGKLYGTQAAGANGYAPSASVITAQKYLESVEAGKPGAYQSGYTDQLKGIYDKIMNREKFTFDVNGDALYQQYKDQYMRQGKAAMQDTMGQAAALTGGYGNSYAQAAGQQEYGRYVQALNDKVPELEARAYGRYQDAGNDLMNQYAMAQGAEGEAYGRYQDAVANWQSERDYAQGAYSDQYAREYGQHTDAQAQKAQAQQYAYQTAMSILQTGKMPTDALLSEAGLSAQDAQTLAKAYKKKSSGSGSGSGKKAEDAGKLAEDFSAGLMTQAEYAESSGAFEQGGTGAMWGIPTKYAEYLDTAIMDAYNSGKISNDTLKVLAEKYKKDLDYLK